MGRNSNEKGGTFAGDAGAFEPDVAIHGFSKLAAEVEAEARALLHAFECAVEAHEFGKEAALVFANDTRTPVANGNQRELVGSVYG